MATQLNTTMISRVIQLDFSYDTRGILPFLSSKGVEHLSILKRPPAVFPGFASWFLGGGLDYSLIGCAYMVVALF